MNRSDFVYLNGLMTPASNNYFLSTICHLREQEEMLIYDRFVSPTAKEENAVADLLREEYSKEVLNFPGAAPAFEREAAVWAARIVFGIGCERRVGRPDSWQRRRAPWAPAPAPRAWRRARRTNRPDRDRGLALGRDFRGRVRRGR